jgi:hypothetical protein
MYRVIVRVVLRGRDGQMGLSREVTLPFAPYPELELHGLAARPEWPEVVAGAAWSLPEGCFYADLEDWDEPGERIADLIDHFGPGWELHEPGPVCEGAD